MFRNLRSALGLALAVAAVAAVPATAQVLPGRLDGPDGTVDATTRAAVIDQLVDSMNRRYVFPDKAKETAQAIRRRQQRREYDRITSARAFADSLTAHVQAVTHDLHLRVRYNTEVLPDLSEQGDPPADELERMRVNQRRLNYGFEKVQRLAGNVGYLDLRNFHQGPEAFQTATAAMNFLGHSDALIVDLRRNGGGSPEMIQLLSTYLFDGDREPVHLNDLYFRPENQTTQFRTLPFVPGKRMPNADVYVLTSRNTFSAAEEFTYNLKNLKRATIVGETTGGGAHPGGLARLGDHFSMFISSGRAINPITGTNWEGTGVSPDVAVPAGDALKVAHVAAIRKMLEKAGPDDRPRLERALAQAEKTPSEDFGPPPAASAAAR